MTNLTLRSLDIPSLHKHTVGFDTVFDRLLSAAAAPTTNYPPYNIVKIDEDHYVIELAVAGFKDGDIDITVEKNQLSVKGEKIETLEQSDREVEYLHRGISARNFYRCFTIGEYVEVVSALIQDGILTINLERQVPEEKKPKKIAITYTK